MAFATVAAGLERFKAAIADAGVDVTLLREMPGDPPGGSSLGLRLLDVAEHREDVVTAGRRVTIRAAYVVAAWAATADDADQLLVDAAATVEADDELELLARPVPLDFWRAHGTPPRPAFLLGFDVERARPWREAPRIEEDGMTFDVHPWAPPARTSSSPQNSRPQNGRPQHGRPQNGRED